MANSESTPVEIFLQMQFYFQWMQTTLLERHGYARSIYRHELEEMVRDHEQSLVDIPASYFQLLFDDEPTINLERIESVNNEILYTMVLDSE